MKKINFNNRQLTTVPGEVCGMHDLEELSFFKNELTTLPGCLWKLTSLRNLNLGDNKITSISEDIINLQHLHTIDLGHNRLQSLPKSIGNLPDLSRFLYLSNNQLTSLPNLEKLDLRWNDLKEHPTAFRQLEARGCIIYI
jgi:Leucine-rich repeat (LRR) protein